MKEGKIAITAHLPVSLYNRLDGYRQRKGVTIKDMCCEALETYIGEKEKAEKDEERS